MSEDGPVVLDASAVLAYLQAETGWERVETVLVGALMSTVNFSEVLAKVAERGGQPGAVDQQLRPQLELVPFSAGHALTAATLRPLTKHLGLSLGDRACLALGLERGVNVLTVDKAWAGLDSSYRVEVLR
ncbi:type II toxin-antitoxin system VapC family toxin [Deinococcus sp. SM5_A1]|uniref:type II toxin-antitoxin system VapC family toxin n=1 Tax=Deinococcus sp. SM5_A1 TaxID=3379094 RepID=UPI00385DA789